MQVGKLGICSLDFKLYQTYFGLIVLTPHQTDGKVESFPFFSPISIWEASRNSLEFSGILNLFISA